MQAQAPPLASPRGILKTAASRAERRVLQHAAQAAALLERPPLTFKVLVLGGPGVGKSAVLRGAGGRALPAEELAAYAPTRTPAFATLLAATFQGRVVYLQLWEVPFALVVAEAMWQQEASSSSSSDGRRYPCSGHLDVALAGAHAAVLVADAREAATPDCQPLRVSYALFGSGAASGAPAQRRTWTGSSLEACDLARRVLHRRGQGSARPMPLYLLLHKADHPAALAASLAVAMDAEQGAAAAAGGTGSSQLRRASSSAVEELGSGVDAAAAAAAAAAADGAEPPAPLAAAALPGAGSPSAAAPGSLLWAQAALAAPSAGHGVRYLRFFGGGALTPGDLTRYAAACGFRGWGWGSVLSALAHAPLPPSSLLREQGAGRGDGEVGWEGVEEEGGEVEAAGSRRGTLPTSRVSQQQMQQQKQQQQQPASGSAGAAESERGRTSSSLVGFFLPLSRQPSFPGEGRAGEASRRSKSFAGLGGSGVDRGASSSELGGGGAGQAAVGVLEGELARRLAGLGVKGKPVLQQPHASLKALIALITDDLLEIFLSSPA